MRVRKKRAVVWTAVAVAVLLGMPICARLWVYAVARSRVYADVNRVPKCRVAVVLGCKVHHNGKPSTLLADRVKTAVALYSAGKVDKLLMSGDNRVIRYNEPQRMQEYAVKLGVPAEDVVMDFAGRRTYDSIYRAKHIFGLKRFVVVSQRFHLDRALFISRKLGLDAYGVMADSPRHRNARAEIREFPACIGALVDTYLRQPHPVMGKKERI